VEAYRVECDSCVNRGAFPGDKGIDFSNLEEIVTNQCKTKRSSVHKESCVEVHSVRLLNAVTHTEAADAALCGACRHVTKARATHRSSRRGSARCPPRSGGMR
jgi:hypothetical protein